MRISPQQTIATVIVGATMAYLSFVFDGLPIPASLEYIKTGVGLLVLPGLFVGMIVGGNIHAFSLNVVAAANCLLYGGLYYFAVWKVRSRRQRQSEQAVPGKHGLDGPSVP